MITAGRILVAVTVGVVLAPPGQGQTCTDPHYRWSAKTDASLASLPPKRAFVSTILSTWTALPLTGEARFRCEPRSGRELTVYVVTGWVRYVGRTESDGDWHIEITGRANTPRDSCIVVEIPPTLPDGLFGEARADLDRLLSNPSGELATPVRLRLIGPALFDGEHRGGAGRRDQTDGSHGHCNLSARALWEIHPVYWVKQP